MRVLLIDDHALFRVGLQGLLERRGIDVAAAGTGREGLRLAKEQSPDIILLDMRMPGMDGLDVLQRLLENDIAIPIVMLTTSSEESDLLAALRAGAQGYLLKDMEPDELVAALAQIAAGKTVVTPQLTGVLISAIKGDSPSVARGSALSELTPREQEILRYLAEGRSNKVMAKHLGISDGTVKLHVKAILRKLGVHSRVEAAVFAVEQGLAQKA